jgi:UDPglucose 6-dehydrogenase
MKVTITGTGYVGLVTGTCLAEMGNDVLCYDVDQRKIDTLEGGQLPIFEPGLLEMMQRNVKGGRLHFTSDVDHAVAHGTLQFLAVGTPPDSDGSADLSFVLTAARAIAQRMTDYKVLIDKSTVPVGTADKVRAVVLEALAARGLAMEFAVVSNPEFLKEGAAVADFMRPDRIVIGCDDERATLLMRALYAPFVHNRDRVMVMDIKSAELTKYAANAMLATRISFMNELAHLAERVGADIEAVRRGIGADPRIGPQFLYAGTGYGGSCFPKDVKALARSAAAVGVLTHVIDAVDAVNERQKTVLLDKVLARLGADLTGRTFAVWGLAFKPNTDDMREAPSREVIAGLVGCGARVRAYDPVAMVEAQRVMSHLEGVAFVDSAKAALADADALVIVTEWKEFRTPDFDALRAALKQPLVFDGRNLYDPKHIAAFGLEYHSIGRSPVPPGDQPERFSSARMVENLSPVAKT